MSGIAGIIEMIEKKTDERVNSIIKRAEDYKAKKIEAAQEEAKRIHSRAEAEARREAEMILKRNEANAKLKAKQQVLQTKNELIEAALKDAYDQALKTVGQKKFEPILRELIIDAGAALASPELEIVIPEGQELSFDLAAIAKEIEKRTKQKTKVRLAEDRVKSAGGAIVRTKDGRMWVDDTIEARYERLERHMRDKVASILFPRTK